MTYTKLNVLTRIFNLFFSAPICASSAQICDTDNTALLQLPEMSEIHITGESVGILLHKLNPHSAHGPDGTSNHIILLLFWLYSIAYHCAKESSLKTGKWTILHPYIKMVTEYGYVITD